jgi:hypothetical protein
VDAEFDVTGPSALDIPLAVHQLISRAITRFINKLSVRPFCEQMLQTGENFE